VSDAVKAPIQDCAQLRTVIGRLSRRLQRTRVSARLTPVEADVLATIAREGPIRTSELARNVGLNPTMLSRVVRGLNDLGLVRRWAEPDDGRVVLVDTTAAGRRLHERIRNERTGSLNAAFGELTEAQRQLIGNALPALELLAENLARMRS
jgi:DNA-binding MarR family transcriptional regulator